MKKEKKNKKIIIIIIIAILVAIIGVLSYFLFFGDKITINTDGGKVISQIEIKDGEITSLPIIEKDGYEVVAYVNEDNKIVKKGTKVNKKTKLKPIYVEKNIELITVTFYDGEELFDTIQLPKGSNILLPVDPEKEGMIFGGWALLDGTIVIGEPIVNESIVLKATWIAKEKEMVTITIISDGNTVGKYKQEKGSNLKLPSPTRKEGYVFEEWNDEDNNVVNNNTTLEKDITIHAVFVKYNCPSDCVINSDGKSCTKTETKEKETKKVCPDGAFEYHGECVTLKGVDNSQPRQCAAGKEFGNKEVYYGNKCAKIVKRITKKTCPSGYKADGDICKKTSTINCTKAE